MADAQPIAPPTPVLPPQKEWWKSKTFWVNALTLAVAVITVVVENDLVKENPQLVLILGGIVLPIINVFLRWLTSQPITSWFGIKKFDRLRGVKPPD